MDDEEPYHPDALLHRIVRVVEKRAVLMEVELIHVGLAGTNWLLGQARYAVEADGHLQTMPVDGGRLGQFVVDTRRTRSPERPRSSDRASSR